MREDRIDKRCHIMTEEIDLWTDLDNKLSLYPKWCVTPSDMRVHSVELTLKFYEEFIKKFKKI